VRGEGFSLLDHVELPYFQSGRAQRWSGRVPDAWRANNVLRKRSGRQRCDAIANRDALHTGTKLANNAGELLSGREWQRGFVLIAACIFN
jgi:hypothetical protein